MFCSNCGQEIPEDSLFCPSCGEQVSQSTPASSAFTQSDQTPQPQPAPTPVPNQPAYTSDPLSTPETPVPPQKNTGALFNKDHYIDEPKLSQNEDHYIDEPKLSQIDFNNPKTLAALHQIMGSSFYYYLPRFRQIQTYGDISFNWYSFFLGIFHASYRNVWHEWLDKMKWMFLVYIILMLLPHILFKNSAPLVTMIMSLPFAFTASLLWFAFQVVVAGSFDRIYMRHVQKKLLTNDFSPDESFGRCCQVGIVYLIVFWIISSLIYYI